LVLTDRTLDYVSDETKTREPVILWWMPVVALLAPVIWAAWKAMSADQDALDEALLALVWPGVLLYFGTVAILWGGWKLDLE
jgi:hypothetical protein